MIPLTVLCLFVPIALPISWLAPPEDAPGWTDHVETPSGSSYSTSVDGASASCDFGTVAMSGFSLSRDHWGDFSRAAGRLISFRELSDNWDGERSLAPTIEAISDALKMLTALPDDIVSPKVMALPSGDVAIYWDFGEVYAEIGFDGSNSYYAYASAPGVEPVHIDDMIVENDFGAVDPPVSVLNLITDCVLPVPA